MITEFFDNKEFTKNPVKEKPERQQRVLVLCKASWGNYVSIAEYIPKLTVPEEIFMAEEFWGEGDYCEKDDAYYTPEGWYESSFVSDYNWKITDKIIMWEPLPVITDNNFKYKIK